MTAVTGAAATAYAAPASSTSTSAPASTQSGGTHGCASYNQCVQDQYTFRHYGLQVGNIYYCDTVAGCPTGYYFDWWS
ncbi:hypothetical protein GCM10009554_50760 [Kribbella koreensis]|uniref:Uncharacterized protein n=1 Tax=Kribbella koreensis TaxID=57909 RepID=A0ABN1R473_9ACTN